MSRSRPRTSTEPRRGVLRRLGTLGTTFVLLVGVLGPLTPATFAGDEDVEVQADDLAPAFPNGRVLPTTPSSITTPTSGGGDLVDPSIGGPPLFLPYTPPADTVELADERTAQSRALANPDGTFTTEVSDGPINFKDSSGAWQPIDLSLVERGPDDGFDVAATAGEIKLGTADGALGSIEVDGHLVSLTPAAYVVGVKGEGEDINRVDFPDFSGTTPDLWIRPIDIGLEFGATWADASATPSVSLHLDSGDLFAALAEDERSVVFTNEKGEFAGRIDFPILREGDEDGPPILDQVTVTLEPDPAGGHTLTYAIDATWFAAPERVFPVILDPTWCIGEGASGCSANTTSPDSYDTFVFDDDPDSYEVGWTVLRTGYDSRTDEGTYGKMRSILYFPQVTLPDGAVIHDTDLQTRIYSLFGSSLGETISVFRLTKQLSSQYTWTKFGTAYETVGGASAVVPASGYMNWDVDDIVKSFYTRRVKDYKKPYGFLLKMDAEGSSHGEVEFRRWNYGTAADRPLLTITYTVPKVGIDFDPRLGATYAPATMVAGQQAKLPITVENKSGSGDDFNRCDAPSDTDCWLVGYRWFDAKGNLVAGGDDSSMTDLPLTSDPISIGETSPLFHVNVTAPATTGQYTLRLDLIHRFTNVRAWASDYARPSLYYSRNKKILTSSSTRWTGTSAIERTEFSINVTSGAGGSNVQSVGVGSGGQVGIDLGTKNLELGANTGLGFADRLPMSLTYGYNEAIGKLCQGYQGLLGACGWYTNWDERITGGSNRTGFDYTYLGPDGTPYMLDTDRAGQLAGSAPVLMNRQRVTILDETGGWDGSDADGAPDIAAVDPTPGFTPFAGLYVARTLSNATKGVHAPDKVSLNVYRLARLGVRTSAAATAGICFKIHNLTDSAIADDWFCYTVGSSDWTTTYEQIFVSGTVLNAWQYVNRDLFNDVRTNDAFGTETDDYQVVDVQVQSSSGSNSGYTYVDGFRFESADATMFDDTSPTWTAGTSTTSTDRAVGTASIKVSPGTGVTPNCTTQSACWGSTWGETWFNPFADWYWRKAGGASAAMVFYLHNERSGGPCNSVDCTLTYYSGARPSIGLTGTTNVAIRISPTLPTSWTLVRRNVLEDARQALNMFDDAGTGAGDNVRIRGYAPVAVDGAYLLVDRLSYGQLADVGAVDPSGLASQQAHPGSAGDATFTYDFTADYADGSRHYFNRDGLLTRIRDRDQQQLALDWSIDPATAGPTAYTLTAVHAAGDGTSSGGVTFDRQFTVSRGTDGALGTIRFDELLGSTASDSSDRAAIFEVSSPTATSFSGGPTTATLGTNGNRAWLGAVFYPKAGTTVTISGTPSGTSNRSIGIFCPEGSASDAYVNPATTSPWVVTVAPGGQDGCHAYIWVGASSATLTGWQVAYTQVAGDLAKLNPARDPVAGGASGTFCGTRPNGCVEYTYLDTTNHRLQRIADPRWDGSTSGAADFRLEIGRSGTDPASILDRSHGSAPLLNILSFNDTRDTTLLYVRPVWQDAAAGAANAALVADLNPDGRLLSSYAPRPCTPSNCTAGSANWPATSSQGDYKASDYEYDGLSQVTTVRTYRCPVATIGGCTAGKLTTMTRSETNAAARVDNYADPLAGGRVAWRASADQVFASLKDSGGTNADWYRTEYRYDDVGRVLETIEVRQVDTSTYADSVKLDGPVAYWRLNETSGSTLTDSSGNGRNGTYTVSPTLGGAGALVRDAANKVPTFNGSSQYAKVTNAQLGTVSGSYTMEAWLKTGSGVTQAWLGSRNADYGFDAKLCAATCTGGIKGVRIDVGSGTVWLLSTTIPFDWTTDRWYAVAVVVDAAAKTMSVFLDGELLDAVPFTTAGTPVLSNATHDVYIGQNGLATEWFAGQIDEVAVSSRVLQPTEIAGHYRAGRAVAALDSVIQRDSAGRPTETATTFLVNPGFEQHISGWALGAGATYDATTANSGAASLALATVATTQVSQLVPGQSFRIQYASKSSVGTTSVIGKLEYWKASTSAWTQLGSTPDFTHTNTSWAGHAYDITLPMDTDGRVRVSFTKSGAGTGSLDDVLLVTHWGVVAYNQTAGITLGLPTDTYGLATCAIGPCVTGTLRTQLQYAAGTTSPNYHPAIFPTKTIANYDDGTQGPGTAEDVTTSTTYDSWGRRLVSTDPDGVKATTVYSSTNKTDVSQTLDGLSNATTMTYDAVGNVLSTTSPLGRVSSATFDARNHALTATAPDGVKSQTDYDNYGRASAAWSNYVNGVVESGDSDLTDDLLAVPTYDAFGRLIQQDADCGSVATCATGGLDARTATTYDLLGNTVASTTYATSAGGSGRTTTNRFETFDPTTGEFAGDGLFSRTTASGVVLPIPVSASPAPFCPDSASVRCNSVSTLDLSGRAILTTDAYGIVARTRYDLDGKAVEMSANYVAGQTATSDRNVVTLTEYDLAGNPATSWQPTIAYPATRRDVRDYDVLGRLLQVHHLDSSGTEYLVETTEYLPSGRVDRTFDGAAWTRTEYDGAGRAIRTLRHFDTNTTNARTRTDGFEDRTLAGWAAGSGWFTLTGATLAAGTDFASASPRTGRGRLRVTTSATQTYTGAYWNLAGPTFVAGHTYRIQADITGPVGNTLEAFLGVDASGADYVRDSDADTAGIQSLALTGSWQNLSVAWTPAATTTGAVHFAIQKAAAGLINVYLDNVRFWDTGTGETDWNIPSSTVYDADGIPTASVLPPGNLLTERELVTVTGFDTAGRATAVSANVTTEYSHAINATGRLAYWPLDNLIGLATDEGSSNDLTVNGPVGRGMAGGPDEARGAYRFNGTSTYLSTSTLPTTAVDDVHLETWFRYDAVPATDQMLVAVGTVNTGYGLYVRSTGTLAVLFSGVGTLDTGVVPTAGPWHYIRYERLAGVEKLFLDGTERSLTNTSLVPVTPSGVLTVGRRDSAGSYWYFKGDIDEVAVWSKTTSITDHWAAGHKIDAVTNLTTRTNYDALGRAVDAWDPAGTRSKAAYDRLGNQTETIGNYLDGTTTGGTAADDVRSTFAYDVLGELIGYCPAVEVKVGGCDPANSSEVQAWHYGFDALGRQTTTVPPDNTAAVDLTTEAVVYETGGRIAKTCRYPAGTSCGSTNSRHIDFTYDNLNRILTQKTWDRAAGSDTLKFTKTLTWNADGSPATVNEGSDTLTYVYDTAGRVSQLKRGATVLTAYTYTADTSTIATRTDGTQGATAFTYDWARRQTVINPPDSFVGGNVTRTYRLDGLLATQAFPSSITETLAYDAAKRPTSISLGGAGSLSQTFDRAGRVTSDGRSLTGITGDAGTGTQTFTYDALSRLTGSTGLAVNRGYQYDLDGNRTQRVEGATTTTYTYDRADQVANQVIGGTTRTYDYDRYGNLLTTADDASSITTYAYDEASRLTTITPPTGGAVTFTLDALDRHATRLIGGSLSDTYSYLDAAETAWQTGTGTPTSSLLDADGSRLAVKTGSTVSWLVFDLHGSVTAMCTSGTSTIADAYRFDGFGQQIASSGSASNPWRYRGLLNIGADSLTGALLDMGARDYSPQLGAFTQQDSVQGSAANPMTMNRFLYALANPATLIDPDGHMACLDVGTSCTTSGSTVGTTTVNFNTQLATNQQNARCGCPRGVAPNGVAPMDESIGFTGYAPWDMNADEEISLTYGNAVASCIGEAFDDPACQLAHAIDDWKRRNEELYCSFHRAECDVMASVGFHAALGGLELIPGVDLIPTAIDAAAYAFEGDLGAAGITVLTVLPAGDALRILRAGGDVAQVVKKGDVTVYIAMHGGEVRYVGITNDIARRGREHLAPGGIGLDIDAMPGMTGLTRLQARSVEQVLIKEYGGPARLLNSINSIAETRGQFYADAILRGCALLLNAGHSTPNVCG